MIASIPFLLMGVISMPRSKEPKLKKDGIVNIDLLVKKVTRLNKEKKHEQAIKMLMTALEGEDSDSLLRPLLLQSFDMFLGEQIETGEKEIRNHPKNTDAYIRVANSLELLDNKDRAMEILVHGVSINPDNAAVWMQIGKLEHKAGREMEALDVFKEVIRQNPKNADAFNNAAFVLAKSNKSTEKDLKEAEDFAKNARKLDPKNPEYLDTYAELLFRSGNSKMAQSLIKEAIKLAPDREFFKHQLKRFSESTSTTK
ncbi:MAG TPA: hypothetical protein VEK06_02600 [Myxococcota bacterium]|nr:hypothetical protein [Myxococcota bacterium]